MHILREISQKRQDRQIIGGLGNRLSVLIRERTSGDFFGNPDPELAIEAKNKAFQPICHIDNNGVENWRGNFG